MKHPKMSNNTPGMASKKSRLDSSTTSDNELNNSVGSTPTKSRFGRSHKPKVLGDFLSTDKRVSALLKVNPGNTIKYFMEFGKSKSNSPKRDRSPKKSPVNTPPKVVRNSLILPPLIPKIEVKVEATELEPVPGCEWMVGDLAWARVGSHPFWPCIINIDPTLGIFTRIRMFSRSLVPMRRLHVQFFGDNGRRSWLSSSAVMNYSGKEAFESLAKSILSGMRRKDPRQMSALVVKPHLKNTWDTAVKEADALFNSSREERVMYFRKRYPYQTIPIDRINQLENESIARAKSDDATGRDNSKEQCYPFEKRSRKRKAETSIDTVVLKQIKLEVIDPNEDEMSDISSIGTPKSQSSKKLSILERVKMSQNKNDTEESRSPSLRLQKKKEEEEERKKMAIKKRKLEEEKKIVEEKKIEEERKLENEKKLKAEKKLEVQRKLESVKKVEDAKRKLENRKRRSDITNTVNKSDTTPMSKHRMKSNEKETNSKKGKPKEKPKKKRSVKLNTADFHLFCRKHFETVLDEHPDLKEKAIQKHLEKMWLNMDDQQKLRYRQKHDSDIIEEVSDREIEESGTSENEEDGNSEKEDRSLEKEDIVSEKEDRNSEERTSNTSEKSSSPSPLVIATSKSGVVKRGLGLFNGAFSGKVCQICEKPGDTLRCKGPCSGTYHLQCALNPIEMSAKHQELQKIRNALKRRENRLKKKSNALEEDDMKDSSVSNQDISVSNHNGIKSELEEDADDAVKTSSGKTVDNRLKMKKEKNSGTTNECEDKKSGIDVEETSEDKKDKVKVKKRKGSKESNESGEEASESQGEFRCPDCSENRVQPCFFCGLEEKNGENKRIRCHIAHCGKVYHAECLKAWPQTSWSVGSKRGTQIKEKVMSCPQHLCHTCVSDNPAVMKARYLNDKLVRCLRCPTTYHYGNHCLPAGSEIITSRQIICPKHHRPQKKGTHHVNAAWCFICATGGSLICCDLCPTAFHADCLKISPPEGGYICEDCETGRFPLYGEVVWVKLGSYRWWPAEILFPYQIPENIHNLPHARGEFAVKFFGSHDYYWVNRGRVFLFQEGDSGKESRKHSATDQVFVRAVQEGTEAYLKLKSEKSVREAETRPGMKPPCYIKIKTNKPVGAVRMVEANVSSMTPCECDPDSANPCAPDSDCLNRILMVECNPLICPAGDRCNNQLFEKRQYPLLMPYRTEGRGWGLKTLVNLKKGDFVIEYVGEMIDEAEYQRRLERMHESNDENYYFLTIDKDRMLDAGPKGNVARFMNHSCQPNCETQKWTVNGDTRVGLFALCDVPADTELVFNYNLESIGADKKPCMCGAPNCSGFIGLKASKTINNGEDERKVLEKTKKVNRKLKLNKSQSSSSSGSVTVDDICFICGEGGELLICDSKFCPKGYHLSCLKRTKWPQGKWLCPWHQCSICTKGRVKRCTYCVNSYCPNHLEGNIRLNEVTGLVCSKHDDKTGSKEGSLNDSKRSTPEHLGIEVDSLIEANEDQSELENESVTTADETLTNVSTPAVDKEIEEEKATLDKKCTENKPFELNNESLQDAAELCTLDNDLCELTVTKPTREYRNKRLKSISELSSSDRGVANSLRRKRPASIDSPISSASDETVSSITTNSSTPKTRLKRLATKQESLKIDSNQNDSQEQNHIDNAAILGNDLKKKKIEDSESSAIESSVTTQNKSITETHVKSEDTPNICNGIEECNEDNNEDDIVGKETSNKNELAKDVEEDIVDVTRKNNKKLSETVENSLPLVNNKNSMDSVSRQIVESKEIETETTEKTDSDEGRKQQEVTPVVELEQSTVNDCNTSDNKVVVEENSNEIKEIEQSKEIVQETDAQHEVDTTSPIQNGETNNDCSTTPVEPSNNVECLTASEESLDPKQTTTEHPCKPIQSVMINELKQVNDIEKQDSDVEQDNVAVENSCSNVNDQSVTSVDEASPVNGDCSSLQVTQEQCQNDCSSVENDIADRNGETNSGIDGGNVEVTKSCNNISNVNCNPVTV